MNLHSVNLLLSLIYELGYLTAVAHIDSLCAIVAVTVCFAVLTLVFTVLMS